MSIEEMKDKLIKGYLQKGWFTSKNENGEDTIIEIWDSWFSIKVSQKNGWLRENIYTYDNGIWIEEELYSK